MVNLSAPIDVERCKKWGFLRYYLPVYTDIISNNFPTFYYIDPMAGPGTKESCIGMRPGSPIVALKARDKYHPFTNYILSDLNFSSELAAEIDKFFRTHSPVKTRHKVGEKVEEMTVPRENVQILSKDVSALVSEDLSRISDRNPCFIFLDPEGISEIPWDTVVQPCIQRKHTEVLLLYCTRGVTGCVGDIKSHPTLDAFFGNTEWRSLLGGEDCAEKLVAHYMGNVQKHKKHVFQTEPIKNVRNTEVYRLIFATDNPTAKKLWEKHTLSRVNELYKENEHRKWLNQTIGRRLSEWF